MVMDAVGASETGSQMSHMSAAGKSASTGTFTPGPGAAIVNDDLTAALSAGHTEVGWLAQEGRVPLGYLGDADKTARTFPVIDGTRYAVPGRSEERRVGKECVSTCRSRWSPAHSKKNKKEHVPTTHRNFTLLHYTQ